jgi:hypothetical protein
MSLKRLLRTCAFPIVCIAVASWGAAAQAADVSAPTVLPAVFNGDGSVQLPTGYRRWQHVGARVKTGGNSVLDGSKIVIPQVMNAYVEPGAFDIYRTTGKWPEGSQIVKDFSSIETGKDCGASSFICSTPYGLGIFETRFIGLGMMVKDSRRFPAQTGHWGYFSFLLDGQHYASVSPVRARSQCSSCHEANASATDYVFSVTHIGLLPENLH